MWQAGLFSQLLLAFLIAIIDNKPLTLEIHRDTEWTPTKYTYRYFN